MGLGFGGCINNLLLRADWNAGMGGDGAFKVEWVNPTAKVGKGWAVRTSWKRRL